ncbi:MAG: hypothetical protein C4575_05780 [Desulforudis sp.]|jgi:hypothetical protein|nr:MAG: hypothetical protein C4575_05780 [Desulforudis sp.]
MRQLSAAEVNAQKVAELGLDPRTLDLASVEAISGAIRRMASFLCPCTAPTLVRGVVRPLRGLVDDLDSIKGLVEETLEAIIAHGDILEHSDVERDSGGKASALLYAAPASFVFRESGSVILIGVTSDQLSALPEDLEERIEYINHLRRLSPVQGEDLRSELLQLGLIEISYKDWLRAPLPETSAQHVAHLNQLLDSAQPSRDVPGLSLLDTARGVLYYRGRWVKPLTQSGRFVARRSQAYGADLWCYVKMSNGNPERLIDLPITGSRWRGCDEAWYLQMAIDAQRGEPQRFRIHPGPEDTRVIEFFSPVPMWARRRWDAIGEPLVAPGCLFAYRVAEAELEEEVRFVREVLWLKEITGSK